MVLKAVLSYYHIFSSILVWYHEAWPIFILLPMGTGPSHDQNIWYFWLEDIYTQARAFWLFGMILDNFFVKFVKKTFLKWHPIESHNIGCRFRTRNCSKAYENWTFIWQGLFIFNNKTTFRNTLNSHWNIDQWTDTIKNHL